MSLELEVDYTEPTRNYVPPHFSKANRVLTLPQLMTARAELKNGEPPFNFIAAIWLYASLRARHKDKPASWVLEETYRLIPEAHPANIPNYKPT